MAGFDAGTVAALDLDWTFEPLGKGYEGQKGAIEEPTRAQLNAYFEKILGSAKDAGVENLAELPDDASEAQIMKALSDVDGDFMEKIGAASLEATLILCENGGPTKAQLEALPARHLAAFEGWLQGQFTNPPDTNS